MTSFKTFSSLFAQCLMNIPRYRRFFLLLLMLIFSLLVHTLWLPGHCFGFSNYFQFNLTIRFRTIYIVSDLIVVPFYFMIRILLHSISLLYPLTHSLNILLSCYRKSLDFFLFLCFIIITCMRYNEWVRVHVRFLLLFIIKQTINLSFDLSNYHENIHLQLDPNISRYNLRDNFQRIWMWCMYI